MRRARWAGLFVIVLLGIPLSMQLYRYFAHCRPASGEAWRAEQEQTTGTDPCDQQPALSDRLLPITFACALAFTVTAVITVERRRE